MSIPGYFDWVFLLRWKARRRQRIREQLVQALIEHNGDEKHSRDLVARIEQRRAWLCILYPDRMHDMVTLLLSIG